MAGRSLPVTKRLNYYDVNPKAVNGLAALKKHTAAIDERLRALVELRVSQINGCAYCVDLTLVVALINAWNRIAVGFRRMPVERPS